MAKEVQGFAATIREPISTSSPLALPPGTPAAILRPRPLRCSWSGLADGMMRGVRRIVLWIFVVRRRMLTILAVLSLLLCLGLGAACYYTNHVADRLVPYDRTGPTVGLSYAGWYGALNQAPVVNGYTRRFAGFSFDRGKISASFTVPYWFLVTLTMIAPARWFQVWRREWRKGERLARGLCGNCGYDMRESKALS